MKILPQGYKVYVRLGRVEEKKTDGGIILPGKHSEQSRIGEVMAVGNEVSDYSVGDKVLVQYHSGVAIHLVAIGILDDTHRIYNEAEILTKVEE